MRRSEVVLGFAHLVRVRARQLRIAIDLLIAAVGCFILVPVLALFG